MRCDFHRDFIWPLPQKISMEITPQWERSDCIFLGPGSVQLFLTRTLQHIETMEIIKIGMIMQNHGNLYVMLKEWSRMCMI